MNCTVVVEDTELEVTVLDSSIVDGVPTVYVEKNKPTNISVQITTYKGQENVSLSLTNTEQGWFVYYWARRNVRFSFTLREGLERLRFV